MSMVQSSDEHSTACLGNKSWHLPVIWECIRNSLSVWMIPTKCAGLWTHIIVVVIISEYWDWNWTTCMETNEKILICLQAIKNHSDATPSYALMWSYRRGLWWIRRDSNLYLLNFLRPSLRWFFVFLWFPHGVYEIDDFPMLPSGVWVYFYFSVQSTTVSWALASRIGLRGVFDGTVDGLVA